MINSFGWTLLCVQFLQQIVPPILPNLQMYHITDTTKFLRASLFENFGDGNKLSIGELFYLFLKHFNCANFDIEKQAVSVFNGCFIPRGDYNIPNNVYSKNVLVTVDPIMTSENVSHHTIKVFKQVLVAIIHNRRHGTTSVKKWSARRKCW
ncbi:hypothetical protein MHBO_001598 [Bonamia ostreae]|uniref:Uncharacterized protein n=1 Tax=Bonamia ostreae TaxID=126728 RepID=A0ABV2AJN2_9EUKA